ncbi:hypothetical protein BKA70DRAFT_1433 [Coprinopsis sp. MPI-PUGE-AT-0042]|nr:hypothetical protein BKA70DRAFT_1433 [Coprinopsis sp. MPI-PUGE-AT-0042]
MSSLPSFPFLKLPPELQGCILEYAADSSSGKASNLALVSRSAARYVQPRIFRRLCLPGRIPYLRPNDTKIPTSLAEGFLALHVKHLCITGQVLTDEAAAVLAACTGVIDLVLWADFSNDGTVEDLQGLCSKLLLPLALRRLTCRYDHLSDVEACPGSSPHPWLQTLTHFTVPLLKHLTSLTHLCLSPDSVLHGETFSEPALVAVLEARPSLQILLIQIPLWRVHLERPCVDPRIVYRREPLGVEAISDWEGHWEGTANKWTEADECVREKRSGMLSSQFQKVPYREPCTSARR